MSRYSKFNLRACVLLAPDIEVTAQALAALTHPRKSPMACALTRNEDLWIHANAVIAHPYSELPFTKGDFSLDMPGVCVLVCVPNGLANDPINVITEDGNQLTRSALNDYPVFRL
jgi:hypothetical protein